MEKSIDEQELATAAPEQRNWKGICLALLVILIICSLVVTSVILLSPEKENFSNRTRVRLQEVLSGKFSFRKSNCTWISGDEFVYKDMYGGLVAFNANKSTLRAVTANNTFRQHKVEDYSLSSNEKYLLLIVDKKKIHSHTFKAKYIIYERSTQTAKSLHPRGREKARLQYARWGTQGSQIMYVYKNNIYYAPSAELALNNQEIQITNNGQTGVYFNGVPDWLYEEEIFKSNNAVWWSPLGDYLCYASINDSKVQSMVFPVYGPFSDPNNLYSRLETLRYPKPDTPNPIIKLWCVDLRNERKIPLEVRPPRPIRNTEHYVTAVSWTNNIKLSVVWMTRKQNYSLIGECLPLRNFVCEKLMEEEAQGAPDGKSWIEMYESPVYHDDRMYLRLPIHNSKSGYFQHVAKFVFSGERRQFLTRGEYEVTKILSFDASTDTLFYIATKVKSAGERHLYSVKDQLYSSYHDPVCLTCGLGPKCLFNDAIFSPNSKYYILECLGPGVPYSALYSVKNNSLIKMLDVNDEVQKFVSYRALPQNRTFLVSLNSEYKAEVRLYLPPGFKESNPKKYPMVVEAFGGPGTQNVNEKFKVDWSTYLTSQRNFIYAYIDASGGGFRGDRMLQEVYNKLGQIDVEDHLVVTNYLAHNLHFVDEDHIAYWGWGYGGYAATRAMSSKIGNTLQCGIAVAPITSWMYYDSIYAERYLQTYRDNRNGYKDSDAVLQAANLKDRKFMLIHGSADDRVHFQQSMMLAMALNSNGVMYRSQFYPDEDHDLSGVQEHLYRTMESFLDDCFEQSELDFYS